MRSVTYEWESSVAAYALAAYFVCRHAHRVSVDSRAGVWVGDVAELPLAEQRIGTLTGVEMYFGDVASYRGDDFGRSRHHEDKDGCKRVGSHIDECSVVVEFATL
jgi:hypothetical protein